MRKFSINSSADFPRILQEFLQKILSLVFFSEILSEVPLSFLQKLVEECLLKFLHKLFHDLFQKFFQELIREFFKTNTSESSSKRTHQKVF